MPLTLDSLWLANGYNSGSRDWSPGSLHSGSAVTCNLQTQTAHDSYTLDCLVPHLQQKRWTMLSFSLFYSLLVKELPCKVEEMGSAQGTVLKRKVHFLSFLKMGCGVPKTVSHEARRRTSKRQPDCSLLEVLGLKFFCFLGECSNYQEEIGYITINHHV